MTLDDILSITIQHYIYRPAVKLQNSSSKYTSNMGPLKSAGKNISMHVHVECIRQLMICSYFDAKFTLVGRAMHTVSNLPTEVAWML